MEKIGVVSVTFNSKYVIRPFLDSVFSQIGTQFILYIIDNNSNDNTIDIINQFNEPNIKIIKNQTNLGVAAANNIGIRSAIEDNCSNILLLNNDIEFDQNLFSGLLENQKKYKCSLVVPKIMFYEDKKIIWYAGGWFKRSRGFLPFHRGLKQIDTGQFDTALQVEYASTCCLLICKSVFEDTGMMDEKYFVYFDDTDFLYRILKGLKHQLWYCPDLKLFHKVGSLSKSFSNKKNNLVRGDFFIKQNIRNHIYFLRKQKNIYCSFFIVILFFRNNLRFIFSTSMKKDISTFLLINKSFFEGIRL